MVRDGQRWSENGQSWSKIVRDGQGWSELVRDGQR